MASNLPPVRPRRVLSASSKAVPWLVVAAALLLSGCVQAGSGSSSDAGTDGGGCDGKGTCNECLACAQSNPCAGELNTCQNNSSCVAIDECFAICGADLQCREQCYLSNPYGVDPYEAVLNCLYCTECANDCSGYLACT